MELKDLLPVVIILVVVAIIIGIGASILSNVNNTGTWTRVTTKTLTNTSVTVYGTGEDTGGSFKVGARINDGVVTSINNQSGFQLMNTSNVSIGTNNYNFFENGSVIIKPGTAITNGKTFLFTYIININDPSVQSNMTVSGNKSLEGLGSWLPTIALVIIAAIIIGIITTYFVMK